MIIHDDYMPVGWGKKLKKAVKKVAPKKIVKKVSTATKKTAKTVNTVVKDPAFQQLATVGATALAGPAGTMTAQQAFSVINASGDQRMDLLSNYAASALSENESYQQAQQAYNEVSNIQDQYSAIFSSSGAKSAEVASRSPENYGSIDKSGFSTVSADTTPQTGTPASGGKNNMMIIAGLGLAAFLFLGKRGRKK